MRRKDREIIAPAELLELLKKCDPLRVGMVSDGEPYVVPVSFAVEQVGETVHVYFHSAPAGRKVEALAQNPRVCVEGDICHGTKQTERGITALYESVIGFGEAKRVEGDEKLHALRLMVERYGYGDYDVAACHGLSHTLVYKITLNALSGKRN